jgi:hypothetical protein
MGLILRYRMNHRKTKPSGMIRVSGEEQLEQELARTE